MRPSLEPFGKREFNVDHRFAFPDAGDDGDGIANLSPLALSYTAGLLSHAETGALLAFTNPSTNSYRRLVPGFEAPISATFAKGSRCAAVRIPSYLKKDSTRIEYRPGDASANIYYMLAAMVMAGCDGIDGFSVLFFTFPVGVENLMGLDGASPLIPENHR